MPRKESEEPSKKGYDVRWLASRPALFLAAAWGIGVLIGDGRPVSARAWASVAAIGVGAAAALWMMACRAGSPRWLLPTSLAAALLALAAAGAARTRLAGTPPPGDVSVWIGRQVGITGTICREPAVDARGQRLYLAVEQVRGADGTYPTSGKVYVFGPPEPPVALGERVEVFGVPERPLPATNPGGFSMADWMRREGCFATLRGRPRSLMPLGRGDLPWWQIGPVRLRLAVTTANRRALEATMARRGVSATEQGDRVAVIHAIAVGAPDAPEADWPALVRRFREAGVIHVLVVSGAQVALLLWLLLLPRFWIGLPASALLALPGLWLYVLMTGAEASIVRAAIMGTVYLVGRVVWREAVEENSLGWAAFLLLLATPLVLYDVGFQLSFLAVAGLVWLARPIETALRPRFPGWVAPNYGFRRWVRGIQQFLGDPLTLAAAAAAAPLFCADVIAHTFQRVYLVSVASSFVAVPLGAAIWFLCLPVTAVNVLCGALGESPPPGPLNAGNELILALAGALDRTAGYFAGRGWAWVPVFPPGWPAVALSIAGLILIGVALSDQGAREEERKRPREASALMAAVGLFLQMPLVVAMFLPARPPAGVEWTFLDVGQGDCCLARFPDGGTMLVDGGGTPFSDFDVGERVVAPALRAIGVRRLDLVVLTHAHEDHVGGLPAVLREFRVGRVLDVAGPVDAKSYLLFRELVRQRGIPYTVARRGMRVGLGPRRAAVLEVLHPPEPLLRDTGSDVNNSSIVLRVTAGEAHYLLAGDAEAAAEASMRGMDVAATLLKVGHHGSRTSTGEAWLSAVQPRLAVISCGRHNPFGHPRPGTLRRLERHGVTLFRTDRDGAVTVVSDGEKLSVRGTVPTTAW